MIYYSVKVVQVCLFICFLSGASAYSQRIEPRQLHNKLQFRDANYEGKYARIVVKFHDGSGIRAIDGLLQVNTALQNFNKLRSRLITVTEVREDVQDANALVERNELTFHPLIKGGEENLNKHQSVAESYWQQEMPEMQTYIQIALRDYGRGLPLKSWVEALRELSAVEIVYAEPMAEVPDTQSVSTPPQAWDPPTQADEDEYLCNNIALDQGVGDLSAFQAYRGAPPTGINANVINSYIGGQGENIRLIDIEGGYLGHADHVKPINVAGTYWIEAFDHGNKVIGIIASLHNGLGLRGIAPEAELSFQSIISDQNNYVTALLENGNVANLLINAVIDSQQEVVLLELQRETENSDPDCVCQGNSSCLLAPMEYWPAEYDAIKLSTGNGTVVVEAAGNGARNLDSAVFNTCGGGSDPCFDRQFRDSGAILVSGSLSDGVTPECGGNQINAPNYGSRIDVHSWSRDVVTTSHHSPNNGGFSFWEPDSGSDLYIRCNKYIDNFNGTSSASAIIAGAVTAVQSLYLEYWGQKMDPLILRTLLWASGTPQVPTHINGHNILIGTHPDLGILTTMIVNGWWPWMP